MFLLNFSKTKDTMGCCTPKCALNYHIAMAIVGIIAGLISFFVFDFYYHNYHAGSWGLLAGLISIGSLHLHLLFKFSRLHTIHTEKSLTLLVFLGLALTTAAGIGKVLCVAFILEMLPVSLVFHTIVM